MIPAPGGDRELPSADGPVLVRRSTHKADRPLITAKDIGVLFWLAAAVVIAPLPRAFRWRVCRLAARFASRSRRAADAGDRLRRIGGLSAQQSERAVRELYAGRLATYLDVVRGTLIGPDVRVACRGLEHIGAAQARGCGVILWVSDFVSAGDVSKVALARAGYRVAHLSRPEHGFTTSAFGVRFLNPLRIRFESTFLAERIIFDRANPKPAMSRIVARLRANGIVSIMASMHEGGTLAELPFMAGRLKIALGALRLARLAGAAVIPVFALRDRDDGNSFELIFGAPLTIPGGPREVESLLAAAQVYQKQLEAFVRIRPECWVGWRRSGQLSVSP